MKTKHNPISTAVWILGISIAISIVLLISAKLLAGNQVSVPTDLTTAAYNYAHSMTLYPVLTWSIAGILILASGIAVIRSRRKASRTAIIAILYLIAVIVLTKAAALSYSGLVSGTIIAAKISKTINKTTCYETNTTTYYCHRDDDERNYPSERHKIHFQCRNKRQLGLFV